MAKYPRILLRVYGYQLSSLSLVSETVSVLDASLMGSE